MVARVSLQKTRSTPIMIIVQDLELNWSCVDNVKPLFFGTNNQVFLKQIDTYTCMILFITSAQESLS